MKINTTLIAENLDLIKEESKIEKLRRVIRRIIFEETKVVKKNFLRNKK